MKADISQGFHIFLDGNAWCAVGPNFRDLQQDRAGFGRTPSDAYEAWWQANCRWLTQSGHTKPDYAKFVIHELDTAPEATRESVLTEIKTHLADQGALTWTIGTRDEYLVRSHDLLIEFMNCAPSVPVPSEGEMREIAAIVFEKRDKNGKPTRTVSPNCMRNGGYLSLVDPDDILAAMRELASRMGGKS